MLVWLECFREAIDEVKGGRTPVILPELMRSPSSTYSEPHSAPLDNLYRDMRSAALSDNSPRDEFASVPMRNSSSSGGSKHKSANFFESSSRSNSNSPFAQSKTEEAKRKKQQKDDMKRQKLQDQLEFFADNFGI